MWHGDSLSCSRLCRNRPLKHMLYEAKVCHLCISSQSPRRLKHVIMKNDSSGSHPACRQRYREVGESGWDSLPQPDITTQTSGPATPIQQVHPPWHLSPPHGRFRLADCEGKDTRYQSALEKHLSARQRRVPPVQLPLQHVPQCNGSTPF